MGRDPKSEVLDILKDLQKRMGYLEKKIDILSEGSAQRSAKPRSYAASRSSVASQGARSPGGFSRYKDKHESAFGAKTEGVAKWYDKKRGADQRGAAKGKKKVSKPATKKRA